MMTADQGPGPFLLTHLPLLQLEGESAPFGDGVLRAVPFEEFDEMTLGAFTDSKLDYVRTAPVFYVDGPGSTRPAPLIAAALTLAVPDVGIPRPDLSLSIVVGSDGIAVSTTQGHADLELLFHHTAAGPPLTAGELDRARALLGVVERAAGEQLDALEALCTSSEPSMGQDERLTTCAVALEALLLPEITSGLRETFTRRLANLVGQVAGDDIAATADAVYRARTQSLHRIESASRGPLDAAAALLLAMAIVCIDGSRPVGADVVGGSLERLRGALDAGPVPLNANATPALSGRQRHDRGPASRLPYPSRSMSVNWHPSLPPVEDDDVVMFVPLPGLASRWLDDDFPLTALTGNQVVNLEDPDIRRDWMAALRSDTATMASIALRRRRTAPAIMPAELAGDVDELRTSADDAVTALRLAGLSSFVSPDLLGDYALTGGHSRYRRPTIYRQTAMMRGTASDDEITDALGTRILDLWSLLLAYRAGPTSPTIDEVLLLFRRAHDTLTLPAAVRAQFLFACLELMLGRTPREGAASPMDDLSSLCTPPAPEAFAWYRSYGRAVRNAVAHGYWEPSSEGPLGAEGPDHLLAVVRAVIPAYVCAWLGETQGREPRESLRAALKAGAALDPRVLAVGDLRARARELRYRGLDAEVMKRHGRTAFDAGDIASARGWFTRAMEAGDLSAAFGLGLLEREAGNVDAASDLWRLGAKGGDPNAMNSLGVLSRRQGDLDAARAWYGQAVAAGNAQSAFNWALMEEDEGNDAEAFRLYELVADAGNPAAMNNLGIGLMRTGDPVGATAWWEQAAAAGHAGAMGNFAEMLRRSGDVEGARTWWEQAAAAGDSVAVAALQQLDATDPPADST